MNNQVVIDAGPLVASIDRRDDFHQWAKAALGTVRYPIFTCEPVITESCFLLRKTDGAVLNLLSLISEGLIRINFSVDENANALSALMARYKSVPMSLADACLVRMAELNSSSVVMTIDSDFTIYRMHRNQPISIIMPEDRQSY